MAVALPQEGKQELWENLKATQDADVGFHIWLFEETVDTIATAASKAANVLTGSDLNTYATVIGPDVFTQANDYQSVAMETTATSAGAYGFQNTSAITFTADSSLAGDDVNVTSYAITMDSTTLSTAVILCMGDFSTPVNITLGDENTVYTIAANAILVDMD